MSWWLATSFPDPVLVLVFVGSGLLWAALVWHVSRQPADRR